MLFNSFFRDDSVIMNTLFFLTLSIIQNSGENLVVYTRQIFNVLLTVQSSSSLSDKIKVKSSRQSLK